eukprot:4270835-Amphidinium_carterae.1
MCPAICGAESFQTRTSLLVLLVMNSLCKGGGLSTSRSDEYCDYSDYDEEEQAVCPEHSLKL